MDGTLILINTQMKQRYHNSQKEVKGMNTTELREQFLVENFMNNGEINFTYSHYDRVIVGGAVPTQQSLALENFAMLRAEYFLERREMGVINIGGSGSIVVDGNGERVIEAGKDQTQLLSDFKIHLTVKGFEAVQGATPGAPQTTNPVPGAAK